MPSMASGAPESTVGSDGFTPTPRPRRWGLSGSPTILVDGVDLFGQPDAVVGLSCRLQRTAQGTTGAPSIEHLTSALGGSHADRSD